MRLSAFGERFSAGCGIVSLMEDLGDALRNNPDMLFLGGGNPAHIESLHQLFATAMQRLLANPEASQAMFGVYQSPAGDQVFRQELAQHLNSQFGWGVTHTNIALANGSQSAFFTLFNLLAGEHKGGQQRCIHLPLVPEYLGYTDLGLSTPFFRASRPRIEILGDQQFKYHLDMGALTSEVLSNTATAALAVSRPTNPTGNMISDAEMAALDKMAREADIPLIVDGAYGLPFPGIVFTEATCRWNDNTILVLSLSKLGFPGARTSIVIASEAFIEVFAKANTVLSLATGNIGPAVALELLRQDQLLSIGRTTIAPFYQQRCQQAVAILERALAHLPCRIHKPEGAIFLWLWFEGLPVPAEVLYERLKALGVLVIAGEHFFPGLDEDWPHRRECIRVSYAQPEHVVEAASAIIAKEVTAIYEGAP